MTEIGGYFGLEEFHGQEFHPGLIALNTGRNALLYILRARKIQKLYIPYFLCDSVSGLCRSHGFAFEQYHIGSDFRPILGKQPGEGEFVYIVNYFGQIPNEEVLELKEQYGRIIFDNVQAFFQKPVEGIDTIYSCRKFFGVPDGSYLSTGCLLEEELEQDVSSGRMGHILGRFEHSASEFYADFQANDKSFTSLQLKSMSRLTRNILRGIDYRAVQGRREGNFALLHSLLAARNGLQPSMGVGPYCYPFLCENGPQIRRELAGQKIYVPTLWPNVLETCPPASVEYEYARNILPLPVDQRYTGGGVERIVRTLLPLL